VLVVASPPVPVVPVVLVVPLLDVLVVLLEELPPLEQPSSSEVKNSAPRPDRKKVRFIACLESPRPPEAPPRPSIRWTRAIRISAPRPSGNHSKAISEGATRRHGGDARPCLLDEGGRRAGATRRGPEDKGFCAGSP
jgi:hypothetical protein